jgi:hypothetical protein
MLVPLTSSDPRIAQQSAIQPSFLARPLNAWHLLSLDAPTVAALWTYFIAHTAGVALPWSAPAAMFLAVWMLYAADRILDARVLETDPLATGLEARHYFHHRHRERFLTLIAVAAIALTVLLDLSDAHALHLYALLATLLGAWLLLIHARPKNGSHHLPKEFVVGIFFAAAVFIPTIARAPQLRLALLPSTLFFSALCALNCLYLHLWEHSQSTIDHTHWTTRLAARHLLELTAAYIFASLLSVPFLHSRTPAIACALSAALLLFLHATRKHISALTVRALADACLLSPLLFLHR